MCYVNTVCVCLCHPECSVFATVHVSDVYKTLGVGVCSCVYSAFPEIVTELRKQFTVNKLFPYSNKGLMRLNYVPASQRTQVRKKNKNPWPTKALCSTSLFYRCIRPGPPNDSTQSSISLGTWMCRKMFRWEKGSNDLPWNFLFLGCNLRNDHAGWCNGGPWWTATYHKVSVYPLLSLSNLLSPPLSLQLGKWMDSNGRVMDEWGEISLGVAKAK